MKTCSKCGQGMPVDRKCSYCRPCQAAYMREWLARSRVPFGTRDCDWCGSTFGATRERARFCSRKCKTDCIHDKFRVARIAAKPERRCIHCGTEMPRKMRVDAKFCSARCNSSAHAQWRKFAKRTGGKKGNKQRPQRVKIADRDGWRCGICMKAIPKTKRHPDPRALSIDHIIPVSQGGGNEMSNLRATHLKCNLERQDRGGYEQLRLTA